MREKVCNGILYEVIEFLHPVGGIWVGASRGGEEGDK